MNEWDTRKSSFLEEYKVLIDKYNVDFVSFPVFIPTKGGIFNVAIQTEVMDKGMMGTPSTIIV